jgi:hypothetical protein
MDATFSQIIEGWHDFYITTATAAATLVGLLFVAVSLHIDVLSESTMSSAQVVAREAFIHFIFVIAIALVFLVPDQSPAGLGIPLLILGVIQMALNIRVGWLTRHKPELRFETANRTFVMGSIVLPQLGYVVMIVIALTVLAGRTEGLSWLFPVILLLMSGAAASAWNLLLRLAALKRQKTPSI